MPSYRVRHLSTGKEFDRPWMLMNEHEKASWDTNHQPDPDVEAFHRMLPDYNETKLHALPSLASELGLAHVFVKDESTRFGLPAFKILGASWAIHRAICQRLDISLTSTLEQVRQSLSSAKSAGSEVKLVACSEGNWGRACARMASIVEVQASIYVPGLMSEYTQNTLRGEGAVIHVLKDGTYDDAIAATRQDADRTGALMVMDTSWMGYQNIPEWVTQGYSTMLTETDRQVASMTDGLKPNTFFVSVGVGSWAHSVVSHYKAADAKNRIMAVEPETAASLKESLHMNELTAVETAETIMAGMNCGTPSLIAWPVLRDGIHAAVTVTDVEAHSDVEILKREGVNAGPCGAATLAALRKYVGNVDSERRKEMVVVLFSTEGWREYHISGWNGSYDSEFRGKEATMSNNRKGLHHQRHFLHRSPESLL